jgi:hypothetical protein
MASNSMNMNVNVNNERFNYERSKGEYHDTKCDHTCANICIPSAVPICVEIAPMVTVYVDTATVTIKNKACCIPKCK